MFFDTHAHYDDSSFNDDRAQILNFLRSDGAVDLILNPGCTVESSVTAKNIADEYDYIYFAAGVHPEEIDGVNVAESKEALSSLISHRKCVAVGEIGLDYHWRDDNKEEQIAVFESQLQLASDNNIPVIIHDRDAHRDCMDIIKHYSSIQGVFHCYSGSAEMAEILLKNGWYLGFDGPVTYKNARKTIEVLQACPLDRILIETDSPYLSPHPLRGTRNNSSNLVYINRKIAEIKGISEDKMAEITKENGKILFNIK